jgi:hypothetical protein
MRNDRLRLKKYRQSRRLQLALIACRGSSQQVIDRPHLLYLLQLRDEVVEVHLLTSSSC